MFLLHMGGVAFPRTLWGVSHIQKQRLEVGAGYVIFITNLKASSGYSLCKIYPGCAKKYVKRHHSMISFLLSTFAFSFSTSLTCTWVLWILKIY